MTANSSQQWLVNKRVLKYFLITSFHLIKFVKSPKMTIWFEKDKSFQKKMYMQLSFDQIYHVHQTSEKTKLFFNKIFSSEKRSISDSSNPEHTHTWTIILARLGDLNKNTDHFAYYIIEDLITSQVIYWSNRSTKVTCQSLQHMWKC